mgnify:CR=1 FL=1
MESRSTKGMVEALAKVKSAVSNKEIVAYLTHYYVGGGEIVASDGRLVAGAPFPDDREYVVPASEFEKAIDMAGDDGKLTLSEGSIKVSLSRARVNIKTLDPTVYSYLKPEGDKFEIPDNMIQVIRDLAPFMSDDASRPWANGIYFRGGCAYATNNVIVATSEVNDEFSAPLVIPVWAVDFLLSNPQEPTEMSYTENQVAFYYEDGSWLRSLLVAQEPPGVIIELCEPIPLSPGGVEIKSDFREAFDLVSNIVESEIVFTPETLEGGKRAADIQTDVSTSVTDKCTWHPKYISLVLEAATHWDLSNAPDACRWWGGKTMRGLIVGRK